MRFDRKVQVTRRGAVAGGAFGTDQPGEHADLGPLLWADKVEGLVGEGVEDSGVVTNVAAVFSFRWSPAAVEIATADRLVCDGRTYEILGRREGPGRRAVVSLVAKAVE